MGGIGIDDWHMAGWGIPIVLLKYALFLTCWLYFVVILTVNGTTTRYLSLQGSDPNTQVCQEIPRQVNLVAQGDIYGYWSTDTMYSINASAFEITFQVIDSPVLACISTFTPQIHPLNIEKCIYPRTILNPITNPTPLTCLSGFQHHHRPVRSHYEHVSHTDEGVER